MKTLISLIALSLCGCANISSKRVDKDGNTHSFRALTLFGNSAISKLDVDRKTAQTYGGLKIGSIENQTNTDAITAAGEAFGNAIGTALKNSLTPTIP